MVGGILLKASLAVLLPTGAAATCYKEGFEYHGAELVAPGYVISADDCAFQCKITLYCDVFTFKKAANWTHPNAAGACLKFGNNAVLGVAQGPANLTISGAMSCVVPTALPAVPMNGTGLPSVPTMPPLPALPNATLPGLPNATMPNTTLCTNGTCVPKGGLPKVGGGGGFPWWAILLIVLVVAGVAAAVMMGSCDDGKKKKKGKKDKKSKKERTEEAVPVAMEAGEVQSLVRTEAPPPMAEPVVAAAAAPNVMTSQALMTAPAAGSTFVQGQPMIYTSGSPVMTTQVVQMQQPLMSGVQIMSSGARQPQFR